jgi:hypothetical protein
MSTMRGSAGTARLIGYLLQPESDVLDFLGKPHSDPDMVKACREVLEYIGNALRLT